jgi:sulfur carrier protein ThiS
MGQANDLAKQQEPCGPQPKWAARIEDQYTPAPQRMVKVQVLMDQANVAPGSVLVRDLGGEHDLALNREQVIDLAEGNVFYVVPECEAPKPTGRQAPPKLAFVVDDRPEETLRADQTGRTLRELFGFTPEVQLFRDYESPNDEAIGLDQSVRFADGPVFYTRRHKPHMVTITINGKTYELHQEKASVKELKQLAGIPLADVLVKIVNGQMVPLDDNAVVELHCGEVFVSHPRDNASS